MKLGIVGLGRMGAAMSARLREQGFEAIGWDQNEEANNKLAASGLRIAANAREVAAASEIVISSITEDNGARRIFTGPDGFLQADVNGKLFIEMSTLQPMTGRELAPLVEAKGARLIEAPVLGTIPQVRAGTLFAMVGGSLEDLARARVVLEKMTRRILHMGPHGAGYAMKLAANIGLGAYVQAVAESLALGAKQGLALEQMIDALQESATALRLAQGQSWRVEGRKGGHDAGYPHLAQGHHVGGGDRRAHRRADAAVGGNARFAVGCGRGQLWKRRHRRTAEIFPRGDAAEFLKAPAKA